MPENTLPDPLVPAEVDLRDFAFMPLHVVRLRDSGLTAKASGDEFRAAVLLWCASWHQQPAASLPDDDAEIASLCGYGRAPREWAKIRAGALRGWVKCSDGRLYHTVIAGEAREAWEKKLARRARTEAARKARGQQRQQQSDAPRADSDSAHAQATTEAVTDSVTENVTGSKGQGQGQGQGQKKDPPNPPERGDADDREQPARPDYPADFEAVWSDYPPRAGGNSKRAAFRAWSARINSGVPAKTIRDGVLRYRRYLERSGKIGTEFVKQAATFFGPDEHYSQKWGEKQSGGNFYEGIEFPPDMVPMRIC